MRQLTLGSLFDGSGGFPLGALLCGIQPVWASEIEPFPIRVTTKRLPFVKHYGDVSKMDGGSIEPVDIITFGSPCQDMSVAGKRDGLDGSRSSLFYEAIRIIKEMREKTNGKYPRYAVWENVPGAFSSNKGEDFRCVLESFCKVKDESVSIPRPRKWLTAGCIMGSEGGFSVAWRQFDAQYWGVPQRRKRIYLVADFNGGSAGNILFESEGLSGYTPQGFRAWERTAGYPEKGIGAAGESVWLIDSIGGQSESYEFVDKSHTLKATHYKFPPCIVFGICSKDSNSMKSANPNSGFYEADTSRCLDANGGNPTCNQGGMAVVAIEGNGFGYTLNAVDHAVAYGLDRAAYNQGRNALYDFAVEKELIPTMVAKGPGAVAQPTYSSSKSSFFTEATEETANCLVATDYKDPPLVNDMEADKAEYIVRRLTPTECARLQGFPDWWCTGLETEEPTEEEITWWREVFETHRRITGTSQKAKTEKQIIKWLQDPHSDSAEYKMWGDGVSLPIVYFVLSGIVWAAHK